MRNLAYSESRHNLNLHHNLFPITISHAFSFLRFIEGGFILPTSPILIFQISSKFSIFVSSYSNFVYIEVEGSLCT